MDAHALTIKTVRDGPACTLILRGDLDLLETGRFLEHAALAADDLTGRLGFDLAGVLFLDCAGVRALRIATRLAPGRCPVITGSLRPSRAGSLSCWGWTRRTFGNRARDTDSGTAHRIAGPVSRTLPRWIRAPRSSPGLRAARDHRGQRDRPPVSAHRAANAGT